MIDIKEGERNLHDMNENIEHIIHIDEIFELTLRELDSLIDLVGWDEQPWFKFEVVKFKNKLLKRKREFIISDLKNSVTPSRFQEDYNNDGWEDECFINRKQMMNNKADINDWKALAKRI